MRKGDTINILDYMDRVQVPPCTLVSVAHLLDLRESTYRGFTELEKDKGFLTPTARFSMPRGQEMIRILLFRCFEELTETQDKVLDPMHFLEEVIDALNYAWALCVLDPSECPKAPFVHALHAELSAIPDGTMAPNLESLTEMQGRSRALITTLFLAATDLLALLRNRAWQHQAQSLYWDGFPMLVEFEKTVTRELASFFLSWEHFYKFYVAKDMVLQFRIKSKY